MIKDQPISHVLWVPLEKVKANNYNPNAVASKEMQLLYISIKNDGYTQPVVTFYDKEKDIYIIVDGFHRYFVCKNNKDIYDANEGKLPVVVIDKNINDLMSSTIRHNRARGEHSITGMSKIVFDMLVNGWKDEDICNNIGLEVEELIKLKHITGFRKLFEDIEYNNSWESERQIKIRLEKNGGKTV